MSNNKLIAEFMSGQRVLPDEDVYNMPTHNNLCYRVNELQYNTSWDWLMPVVLKCKESVDYCSDDNALKYHHIEDEMLSQLSIEDTYNAVVEFIKEYNDEEK